MDRGIKVKTILRCSMEIRELRTETVRQLNTAFQSAVHMCMESTDLGETYTTTKDLMIERLTAFQRQGSGWRLASVHRLEVHVVKYNPLKGGSYIPLPKALADEKAIINPKNENDHECFKWCVTRAFNPVDKDPQRITKELRRQATRLNWRNMEFPVSVSDKSGTIKRFEKQNPRVRINVFRYKKGKAIYVYPIMISERHKNPEIKTINLITDDDDEGQNQHYCWIKNMSKLLSVQVSKRKSERFFCERCLCSFTSEAALAKHEEYCNSHEAIKLVLPENGTILSFKNQHQSMKVPFVVYADCESYLKPLATCEPNPRASYTNKTENIL